MKDKITISRAAYDEIVKGLREIAAREKNEAYGDGYAYALGQCKMQAKLLLVVTLKEKETV